MTAHVVVCMLPTSSWMYGTSGMQMVISSSPPQQGRRCLARQKSKCSTGGSLTTPLALRPNLKRKGVKLESTKCLFCNCGEEEGAHLFIKCKEVKEVWRSLCLEGVRWDLAESLSIDHALDILWKLSENKRIGILIFWWIWWNNRNTKREGDMVLDAANVAHQARCYALEYLENLKVQRKHQLGRSSGFRQNRESSNSTLMVHSDLTWNI